MARPPFAFMKQTIDLTEPAPRHSPARQGRVVRPGKGFWRRSLLRCRESCVALWLCLSVQVLLSGPVPSVCAEEMAGTGLASRTVIDWHVHVAGLGYGGSGAFINQAMRDNIRFGFFLKWMGVTLEELEAHGDQLVVQRLDEKLAGSSLVDAAVVLAMDGVIDQRSGELDRESTQIYVPNDYVMRETARYPRLLFGASVNPNRADAIERLERVHRQGAWVIKWLPSIMYIDPADRRFIPFYDRMAELDIPLLSHAGKEDAFASARDELSDPRRLELPLRRGVTVIAAHIATTGRSEGEDNFERILPMFQEYPNLYTDVSSLTLINKRGYLARALRVPGLSQRMLYGTDWPLQYWPMVSPWYHLRHIGLGNAWRLSRIANVWDLDVRLKQHIGLPEAVFTRRLGGNARHYPVE